MSTTSTATREETTSSSSSLSCPFRSSSSSNNNNHDVKTALLLEHQEHHPGTTTTTTTTATATAPMEITATTTTSTTTASTTTTKQEDTKTSTKQQQQPPEPHYPKKLSNWVALRFLWATLRGKHHQYLLQLLQQHGDSFMIADQYVVLHDVHAIRDVLETHNLEKTIAVKRGYRNLFRHGKGGILAAPWKRWIEQRRLTAPAFTDRVIAEHLAPQFCHAARPVLQWLYEQIQHEQGKGSRQERRRTPPIEMDQVFTSLTLDAIGLVLLGRSFGLGEQQLAASRHNRRGGRNNNKRDTTTSATTTSSDGTSSHAAAAAAFADALQVLTRAAVRQIVFPRSILRLRPSLAGRPQDIQQARTVIDDVLNDCIDQRLAAQREDKERDDPATKNGHDIGTSTLASSTDLMDILLQAEARGEISRADVKGQLLVFLFAGHDTTAHTLTWLLYEVSRNQELQQALYQEAEQAAAAAATSGKNDHNNNKDKDDDDMDWFGSMDPATLVTDLPLLNAVWMETNRLYPAAATGTTRGVGNRPLPVGQSGLVLPPRVSVSIPPYSLHRHAELWPDRPLEFDPYRFLNSNKNNLPDTVDPMGFQAFSAGPRNCIGGRLARAEALFVVSALLRHFQVHPVQPPPGKRGRRRRLLQRLPFWQRRAGPPPRPEELLSLTLRPKHGIWFEFEPRHQSSLSSPNNNEEQQS